MPEPLALNRPTGDAACPDLSQARVACVIVTFNGAPWLDQCLTSLATSSLPCQIIVVDNASSDTTVSIALKHADVQVVQTGANLGFGRANNIGIAMALEAGADFVFILNQDAYVASDTLALLRREAERFPELGILSPMQLTGEADAVDPTFLQHYLAVHAPVLLGDSLLGKPLNGHYKVVAAPAAAWLLSRRFLAEVGGFDPLFFMYCEDDDLCSRAAHHGWAVAVVPAAKFFHCRGFHGQTKNDSAMKRLKRRRSRLRSVLIRQIKLPTSHPLKSAWHAFVKLSLAGLATLIAHFDWVEALASWAAVLQVLIELPAIARHREICMSDGPHWLQPTKSNNKNAVVSSETDAT